MPVVIVNGKIRIVTDIVELSGTDPVELYRCLPPYNKFVIKKLTIYNPDTADHTVILGEYDTTSSSWSEDKLVYKVLAGQTIVLGEDDIPFDHVMTTNPSSAILAWAAKLGEAVSANNVKIKAEFEIG